MAKKQFGTLSGKLARWRVWVQALCALLFVNPLGFRMHTVCAPIFHCYSCPLATFACPIGVMAQFSALHVIPFIAIGTLLAFGMLFGSLVCGWMCPFGFLQDLVARIPTPKWTLPAWSTHTRYVVLVVFVVAIPYMYGTEANPFEDPPRFAQQAEAAEVSEPTAEVEADEALPPAGEEGNPLFICRLCPAGALEAAVPHTLQTAAGTDGISWPSATKMIILGLFLVAMLFIRRPWCMLFCPLGAIYSVCGRVSFLFLRFHPGPCDDCGICDKACDHGTPSNHDMNDPRCIRCMDCTNCSAITLSTALGHTDELD